MGKNTKTKDPAGVPAAASEIKASGGEASGAKAKPKSKKLKLELGRDTLKRLDSYIDSYNRDPERITPKTDADRVVNEAVAAMLAARAKG